MRKVIPPVIYELRTISTETTQLVRIGLAFIDDAEIEHLSFFPQPVTKVSVFKTLPPQTLKHPVDELAHVNTPVPTANDPQSLRDVLL